MRALLEKTGWQGERGNKQGYSICAAIQKYLGKTLVGFFFPLRGTILTYRLSTL